ncbi:MAG: bifunctional phosphopantothenoylcysteine decarboxylase/phosphopantothenate--cysteine ligase CoaBC [Flavobacteriales bacterium]|nr:bifunctional phosphopantothenoylcysteine decarboxylase/phosphopantothenate--cysteine ligase CoaBC [Flavobacteriales bacterium]
MAATTIPVGRYLNRRVLLGVTGGIAAYKSAWLVRQLVKAGAQVQVVMTPAAHDFVTPLTLATLSGRPVLTDLFVRDGSGRWNDHVHLARWADVMLIAPATANTLAKMTHGQGDNLLLACYLSANCPVYVAPAMDLEMHRDPATRANLETLRLRGVRTIGPESGELASGLVGEGRMTEPEALVAYLCEDLLSASRLNGLRVLVTAGGTQEAIDPVRFIGNRSTGKMGFALAQEAAARGAQVELVTGPVDLDMDRPGVTRSDVRSAADMARACGSIAPHCDLVIMCAAVADYRPKYPASGKMKKQDSELLIELEPTVDILAAMGAAKPRGQTLVGFALETDDELAHAQDKLQRKKLDLLVLNSLRHAGAGFGHDTNRVTLLVPGKDPDELPLMPKADVARAILDRVEALRS